MDDTILLVDDDVRVGSALQRMLSRAYRIEIAASGMEALEAISQKHYPIVVSDLQMPMMDGVELLSRIRQISPDTVRILLTGQGDLEAAAAAVNQGNIFRFLTKPCSAELLRKALGDALEQYRLQVAEREMVHETLTGTVAILVEVLASVQPLAFRRAARIRQYVLLLAGELHLPDTWQFEAAAMLSQIGFISVDPRVLQKHFAGEELSEPERRHLLTQASVGRKLLRHVPRLQAVSLMIEHQYQKWPDCPASDHQAYQVAMGAQLLRTASEFDRLVGTGRSPEEAISAMRREGAEYHPEFLPAAERLRAQLRQAASSPETLAEFTEFTTEQLIYRPMAEEVLRSFKKLA